MKSIIEMLIARRMVANVLTLAVFVLGIYAITALPLAELPRVDLGKADIETRYPGASAKDVEANVTSHIEKELLTVSAIKKFLSVSEDGLSSISVELKSDVKNVEKAYQDIRDAVARVGNLPSGVSQAPMVRAKKSSSLDFMVVGISADMPYDELRNHARALELRLRRLPGIGEVIPKDMRQKEFWIQLELEQLARYDLTIAEVGDIINNRNVMMTGGSLESHNGAQNLVTLAEIKTTDALAAIEVAQNPVVRLGDVSKKISESFERANQYASINGKQVIGFDLRTSETADVTVTAQAVRNLLEQEQARLAGQAELLVGFDLSEEIQSKFDIVKNNGLVGLVLVVITLGLFLNRLIAFWVAMTIPFSLLGVVAVLPLFGQVLDSYTLAAMILIIGIIVDDAVVVSEKIVARHESGQAIKQAIIGGLIDILPAVITSMITTFLAFLPLVFLPGNTGKMLYVMPMTVGLALLFSLIDVMVVLPSHIRPILNKQNTKLGGNEKKLPPVFMQRYKKFVTQCVLNRYRVLAISLVLLVLTSVFVFKQLPYIFFPTQGAYLIEVEAEVASTANLNDAQGYMKGLEKIIAQDSEYVSRWYGSIGAPYSSFLISLKPSKERSLSADEILERWEEQAEGLEGIVDIEFEVDAGGPPKGRPVDINVVGGEDHLREKMADDLAHWLETQAGIRKVYRASEEQRPMVVANMNYALLNRYGVSVYDVARTMRLAVDGERISRVFAKDEEVHYRLLLEKNDRKLEKLEALEVRSKSGRMIQLRELVTWSQSTAPAAIKHYNGERNIRVSAAIDAAQTDPLIIEAAMLQHFAGKDYGSARLVSSGQAQETREALSGLGLAFVLALLAIFLTLILLFDSIWESVVIMSIVPFGLGACGIVLYLHQEPLSFFAIVGMIGLIGVMVNNSLVLVCHYQQQWLESDATDHIAFVVSGSLARVRAVLLTTITTVVGLMPLAYGFGGYDNYMGPIALVMGWGMIASAMVTLVLVPCMYAVGLDYRQRTAQKRLSFN